MGTHASRGETAAAVLAAFVEQAKASGFLAEALMSNRIEEAWVAPAA